MDEEINLGKQFLVSIDVVDGKKISSTTLKNECPTRWTGILTMLKSINENTSAIDIVLVKLYKRT